MVDYELRKFNGFDALVFDCEKCNRSCSLDSNDCVKCVNDTGFNFSLLELKKKNSYIYFDDSLSDKIKSGIFQLVPRVVPKFLLFYIVPHDSGKVLHESDFFRVVQDGNEGLIVFSPLEYDLSSKELSDFSDAVMRIQGDSEYSGSCVPELDENISFLVDSYTGGLGIFESILQVPEIQDVFINSPGDSCVFFFHSKYGYLKSNLYLKKEMINRLGTFLRTGSGRPFDESFPVIHANLKKFNTRVCGITSPLTHQGVGFALRKHSLNPLSISNLVVDNFMDSYVAALLWFLIDSDIKVLVTGPRGSGKTTLLSSLLFLSNRVNRIIVIEDTAELPVPYLKELGFNVEHLRTNSFDSIESFEFSNDAALRTALRLGESLLVLGEVRGTEARFLFEAMRIGASGNNVLGTIHGSNAFDTFDRVVNDLGVPASSFKAADLVISCSYFNSKNVKGRRIFEITEVKKTWLNNPLKEKGFLNLVCLNPRIGKYSVNLKGSDLIKNIAFRRGVSIADCVKEIKARKDLVDLIVNNFKVFNSEKILSNELIVNVCSLLGSGKAFGEILKFINSFILKKDFSDNLVDILKSLKAFDGESAVCSSDLFKKSGMASRHKFNYAVNLLESRGLIEGFSSGHKRYWFICR